MKKDTQTKYPPFDPERLKAAVGTAIKFWQAKLGLTDWLIDAPLVDGDCPGFQVVHEPTYRTVRFSYMSPAHESWQTVSDAWCAHAVAHELFHLLLAPMADILLKNLAGHWLKETDEAEEPCVDRLATLIWGLLPEEEQARITALFAAARKT